MISQRGLTEQEIREFFHGRPHLAINGEDNGNRLIDFDALSYNRKFDINSDDSVIDWSIILGSGEFATVFKGFIKSLKMDVAVKVAKRSTDVTTFKGFLSEVKILSYIGCHQNVVGLIRVDTTDIQNRNLYIYMELCELRSLEKYLRAYKDQFVNLIVENQEITASMKHSKLNGFEESFTTEDLVRWSAEIAAGMEFLSLKSIIHADLAARNVLLTLGKTAKVSDFGLSRKLRECIFYTKKAKCPLPWRWMALESLKTLTFSMHSDVWSYGVTLWEMFSLGEVPFPNEQWNNAFVEKLLSGIRMGHPKFATSEIYSKMLECWEENPMDRPNFSNLRRYFCDLHDSFVVSDVYAAPTSKL